MTFGPYKHVVLTSIQLVRGVMGSCKGDGITRGWLMAEECGS